MREKKIVYMATSAYQVMLKKVENCVFRHNRIFWHVCVYKKPILTK